MLLTPHLIAFDKTGNVQSLNRPQLWGPKVYIVPRSECAFRRITLKGKGRPSILAAKLQLRREALAPDSYVHIVRDKTGQGAGAWVFEKALPAGTRYLPESLAYHPAQNEGRLVAALQGFEGQVWSQGALIASRWWAKPPSKSDWDVFLRASNIEDDAAGAQAPNPQSLALRENIPVFDVSREYALEVFSPKRLLVVTAVICAAFLAFFGAQLTRHTVSLNQAKADVSRISDTAQNVLSQKRKALRNVRQTQLLQSLGDESVSLTGLYSVAAVLKSQGLVVRSIKVNDNVLNMALAGEVDLTIPDIVTRLEAMPALTNVSVSLDFRNELQVKATLLPFKTQQSLTVLKTMGGN